MDAPYGRERAAFPAPWTRERKFWPSVARVEIAYGDRHLVCSCVPIAGQHQRLHHRPGEHELEEAFDRREARQVDGGAGAAGLDRQQQGGEDDDRRDQSRLAEGLVATRAPSPQCPDHARALVAKRAHASTGAFSAFSSLSSSRW